jgi:hypothetical protein
LTNPGQVKFTAIISDAGGNPTVAMPDYSGRVRINQLPVETHTFETEAFRNKIVIAEIDAHGRPLPTAAIWRILVEVQTNQGLMKIRIPTYNAQVQEFLGACH